MPDQASHPAVGAAEVRHDLRLVPLAAAAWAGMWLSTRDTSWWMLAAGIAGLVILVAGIWRGVALLACAGVVVISCLVLGGAHAHQLRSGPVSELAASRAVVAADLIMTGEPRQQPAKGARPPYLSVRGVVVSVDGRGQQWKLRTPVLVTVSGPAAQAWGGVPVGSRLRLSARVLPPQGAADFAAVLRVKGPAKVVAPPGPGLRLVERVRAGLRQAVSGRSADQRALVPALVLGDTSRMGTDLHADFQTTGLTHLNAVSGANLTLLLAFMLVLARQLGVRGWWLRGVGLAGVIIFVALCRTEPSVLRAAAMGLVALAALGADGGVRGIRRGLRALSVAMIILLVIDPWLSRSVGFALSVLASAGIVWWAGRWSAVLSRWLPRLLAESIAVPLAAQLATQPVVTAISGQISVVGIVANALAGPLVGPATVLGFAAAGLSLLSPVLAAVAGFGAAWCAQVIIWIAQLGAQLPGAALAWPTSPAGLLVTGMAVLGMALLMPWLLARPWLSLGLSVILVLALVKGPAQPGWPPPDWVMVACDVGQGDGLVIKVGPHQGLVVDTGPDPELMDRCLDQLGITGMPLVVLTHFHADHVSGLPAVLAGRQVGEIWVSPLASPSSGAGAVAALAGQRQIKLGVPALGETVQAGSARLTVIGPVGQLSATETGLGAENSTENNASLVLRVTVDGVRVLLTGDVEPSGQAAILQTGADDSADVLKIPHHGSSRQDADFFRSSHARVAIASAGIDNDYGHPAPRTVHLVQSLGMTLLRTDTQGSIAIIRTERGIGAVTQR